MDLHGIRIVIAGGGTGGHLYPGIALAQEFERRGVSEILFIGTSYGIENRVLPQSPYLFKKVWMRGLDRKLSLGNVIFPLRLAISTIQCGFHFSRFGPHVVIGTGGYVSGPALIAARWLGIPTVIQEQNSYPGLVNRKLGKWAQQIHLTYEDSRVYFKNHASTFVSGNPIRREFGTIDRKTGLQKFDLDENKVTLFVFGGSQGARAINRLMLQCLQSLQQMPELQILWATGQEEYETIRARCKRLANVTVLAFIEDMPAAYAAADFVVSRAGATALAEITSCGLPAILIPYPYATGGHQDFNARTLEKAGAALRLSEQSVTAEILRSKIVELARDSKKRRTMSAAARKLARPEAAAEIVDKIAMLLKS